MTVVQFPNRQFFSHAAIIKIGEETYECTVSEMSMAGATLIFKTSVELPEQFVLQLRRDGRVTRKCSLVWYDGFKAGVLFQRHAA